MTVTSEPADLATARALAFATLCTRAVQTRRPRSHRVRHACHGDRDLRDDQPKSGRPDQGPGIARDRNPSDRSHGKSRPSKRSAISKGFSPPSSASSSGSPAKSRAWNGRPPQSSGATPSSDLRKSRLEWARWNASAKRVSRALLWETTTQAERLAWPTAGLAIGRGTAPLRSRDNGQC
jgi:hypothetical protein